MLVWKAKVTMVFINLRGQLQTLVPDSDSKDLLSAKYY